MGGRFSSNNENDHDDSDNEALMDKTIHNPTVSRKPKHRTTVKNKNKNKKSVRFTDDEINYDICDICDINEINDINDNDINNEILPEIKKRKPKKQSNSHTKKRRY